MKKIIMTLNICLAISTFTGCGESYQEKKDKERQERFEESVRENKIRLEELKEEGPPF